VIENKNQNYFQYVFYFQILFRPYRSSIGVSLQEHDISDLQLTVEGLTYLFKEFLYKHPTNSADIILTMLMTHLKCHYEQPNVLEHLYLIRFMVIA